MRLPQRKCCIERIEQGLENRALSQRQLDTRRYAAAQQNSKSDGCEPPQPTRLLASKTPQCFPMVAWRIAVPFATSQE
jgi:hypothetical protein